MAPARAAQESPARAQVLVPSMGKLHLAGSSGELHGLTRLPVETPQVPRADPRTRHRPRAFSQPGRIPLTPCSAFSWKVWGVKGRARWALQSLCGGAPALCETLPAPSTSSRRGKGNRLSLNTNHSISISHTLKLAELARLVAGYTRRECPHQRSSGEDVPASGAAQHSQAAGTMGKAAPPRSSSPEPHVQLPAKPQRPGAPGPRHFPLLLLSAAGAGMHQGLGAEPRLGWSSDRGTFPFQSACDGCRLPPKCVSCGKECVWIISGIRSVQLGAWHRGAFPPPSPLEPGWAGALTHCPAA